MYVGRIGSNTGHSGAVDLNARRRIPDCKSHGAGFARGHEGRRDRRKKHRYRQ